MEGDRLIATRASWLKDSHRLLSSAKSNRGLGDLPVVASTGSGRPRLVHSIGGSGRYPMPGDKKVTQYELSLIDAETGTLTRVPIEKWKDQSLKLLKVSQDGHYLYLQRTRRTRDELDICRVDTETGEVKVILNEVCQTLFQRPSARHSLHQ